MTVLEAHWSPAKHLILGEDPQVRVYAETSVWFKKIQLFRRGDTKPSREWTTIRGVPSRRYGQFRGPFKLGGDFF
jgi:hypothetical protein